MNEKDRIYNKVKTIIRQDGQGSSYIGEDDFVSLVKGAITINFHIKHPTLDIQQVYRTVRRAEKIIHDKLGHALDKVDVDIYDSMTEMRQDGRSRSRYASWIAGIFDGKIRVIEERDGDEPDALYILLTHEIIHLAISEISKYNCPYWLDEGLAVYMSQELPDHYLESLVKAVKKNSTLPLELLNAPLSPDAPEDVRQLTYAECASMTEHIVATMGWDAVKSLVQQSGRRQFKNILTDMGLNYYLLEQGWKRWFLERKSA